MILMVWDHFLFFVLTVVGAVLIAQLLRISRHWVMRSVMAVAMGLAVSPFVATIIEDAMRGRDPELTNVMWGILFGFAAVIIAVLTFFVSGAESNGSASELVKRSRLPHRTA